MTNNQYSALATSGSHDVVATATNLTLYTVNCPIALTGTATFRDKEASPATYFVLPVGTIGMFRFDASLPLGLNVDMTANDTIIVAYQTP